MTRKLREQERRHLADAYTEREDTLVRARLEDVVQLDEVRVRRDELHQANLAVYERGVLQERREGPSPR